MAAPQLESKFIEIQYNCRVGSREIKRLNKERDSKSLKRLNKERSTDWLRKAIVDPDSKSLKRMDNER